MSGREGRGRPRRDLPTRSEEKSHHSRGNNPPSRHLWVGNISHNLSEDALARHFIQFGKLESVAFQPGRSYAFINYKNDEDAFAAIKMLQGFEVDGNPLRIEFAKAEKSLTASHDIDYAQRWDEPHPMARGSPFESRDFRALESRTRNSSPELSYPNKTKMNDKDAEPSEVLWVGFPAQLKVDEFILRKAFFPFGDIEKITAFPGRTYAFVRYRTVSAARRAKETLQGKLFGNPRVHICFARNESGAPSRERSSVNAPPSPRSGSYGRAGSSEHFRTDRSYSSDMPGDRRIDSPPFVRNMNPGDPDGLDFSRHANSWRGRNDTREQRRLQGQGSELRLPGNMYDHHSGPPNDMGANFHEFPPREFPRQGSLYDDPWDLPEDASILHGAKRVKTNSHPSENELPEYPFPELGQVKRVHPHDISRPGVLDVHFDSQPSGYRTIRDQSITGAQPIGERGDAHWNASLDRFQAGTVPPSHPDVQRSTPDVRKSSAKDVWKWEGMIVKGGTSVCRARCFPVGKPLDMGLPEYLDCTARTSLDMLAKHYYQAAGVWVVFFVPANDPDIPYYNEFMNYLAERQRAAVAKLDERTTLFLVPPSEFSEKVLKVPGKLSISGVILRLDPSGTDYGSFPQNERKETDFTAFQNDELYQKSIAHPEPYLSTLPSANYEKPGMSLPSIHGNASLGAMHSTIPGASHSISNIQSVHAQGQDYAGKASLGPNWMSHDPQNTNPNFKNVTSQAFVTSSSSITGTYSPMPRSAHEGGQSNYTGEISGVPLSGNGKIPIPEKPPLSSSIPVPEQLAQLASSLLGQQAQYGDASNTGDYKQLGQINQSGYSHSSQNYGSTNEQMSSEYLPPQYGQGQLLQQLPPPPPPNFLAAAQPQPSTQDNPLLQNAGQDDAAADPQTRLQATLQLAAALLQQIQQGKGT